ncbi:MAG: MFS transporter [Treponema sp.]|nr:MFS transporter [Treponema sp.]
MTNMLSPYRLKKARSLFNIFNTLNALSYTILAGSLITIFALRLNASSTFIGVLSSFVYVAYFFLPVGKILAKIFSIMKVYALAWVLRSLFMAPLLAAPFVFNNGHRETALGLIVIGSFCFHMNRGIGMIGNNPVLDKLAVGSDRGGYMTLIQIINAGLGMATNLAIAMLLSLWDDPPLFLYAIIIAFGMISGVISGILLKRLPEPETNKNTEKVNFTKMLKESFADKAFKKFITILFMIALASGVARAFVVVYSREVFNQSDGLVILYTVFGGLGQLCIGFLTKFLIDRIGMKPLFIVCTALSFMSMIPIIVFPQSAVGTISIVIVFLIFLFFLLNFGFLGAEGIAQTYFLGLVPAKYMLDMGIVYFICFGIAGASGSFLAGVFLDAFTDAGFSRFVTFKLLYILLFVITGVALFFQKNLVRLGSMSFKNAIEIIFSFRDLRAITLLDKLGKTSDSAQEEAILDALHDTPSVLSIKDLLERAKSPRLATRLEAFRAMETLSALNDNAEKVLMRDLVNNHYTTAYISARILGKQGVSIAIPVLRELSESDDYMLAGESIIALARLNDEAFRPHIENIVLGAKNPRLKIMGVEAFGIYKSSESLPTLLSILRSEDPPRYLKDEIVLAMANILNLPHFYSLLTRFLEDESLSSVLAVDEAEAAVEHCKNVVGLFKKKPSMQYVENFLIAVRAYALDNNPSPFSQWIREASKQTIAHTVFSNAVLNNDLNRSNRLRLLIVHWCAQNLG